MRARFLRACASTAALAASGQVHDGPLFLFDYALRALRVGVLLALWRVVFGAADEARLPMPLASVLTYTLLAEVFADLLAVRTGLWVAFWQGTIVGHFTRPMSVVAQFASVAAGSFALHFALFSVPLLAIAPWVGVELRPASAAAGALLPASLALAVAVGLALDFLFVGLGVALELPAFLFHSVRTAIAGVLGGSLVPLALYPAGIGAALEWLPFASLAWAPLAIYVGASAPGRLLALQVAWAAALWPLVLWLWRANREKLVAHGG
jgi:ABC-2 type transport system permease protein